ncbi:MAG: NUDIX hydrolase [Oscillospiraceae bacterium]|nr:NUDIX hydrolase [Oscillospiraceae bacterium]
MNPEYIFNIRVTGILIENNELLIVKQKLSDSRDWSLPGGRLERGETIEHGLKREFKEETGLDVEVVKLLYVCDVQSSSNTVLHITFLVKRLGGEITLPTNEFDANPIHDVRFVPVDELTGYGFSPKFAERVRQNFPQSGSYMGDKTNIGLGI